ncbi:MAG: SusC/RagA family TonB-linked outer membrane protein [Bacteroidales bacterium]|nr:SusC/RagA family TonB-linked outer membrane protein [Bacteroidales bacterium]
MFYQTKTNRHFRLGIAFLLAAMLSIGQIFAQNVNVSGKVTDQNGEPVPGAAVYVKGSPRTGTSTDADGRYTLRVAGNAVLVFQSVGYGTIEVPVNNKSVVNAMLKDDATVLNETVITAEFGQKRVQRSVGSAVQNVKATDIQESGRDAFVSALQGRVAGITVTSTGGAPGASTNVILRSVTSVSGNNQPLYVIDGVPMNNNTFDPNHGFAVADEVSTLSYDFSSRGNDLNPEDIESMTILKGAAAAVLYGSDASNGAIVITTKKGSKGAGKITYSNQLTWSKSWGFPEMQTEFANGGYGLTNFYNSSYFGGRYPADGSVKLYDNVKALLQTGFSHTHNVAVEGGTDKITVRGAVSYLDQKGTVKTTDYTRLNITLSGRAEVTKWLNFESTMAYTETTNTKARKGIYGVFRRAHQWPLVDNMKEYLDPDGVQMKLPEYYEDTDLLNPLYDLYKNKNYDESKRFLTTLAVNVTPTKNTFITARMGWDASKSKYENFYHPYYADRNSGSYGQGGGVNIAKNDLVDKSLNILAGYNNQWGDFSFRAQVGYHQQENGRESISLYGSKFYVIDFYALANCDDDTKVSKTINTKRRIQAISGAIELGWKNMAFLNFRGRNDWSSTLPKNNRSYFYPAVEASFIATELPFLKNNDILSYLKLRASYAQVGKDASPQAIYPALELNEVIGGGFGYGYTGPNETLKPEMNFETEVGFEARLLNDRINMDFSYFWRKCKDQYIEAFRLSYATGFVLNNMNVGTFKTWGWEFHVDGDIIRSNGWRWNVGLNLDHNDSEVTYLPENVTEYYNAYTWLSGNLRNGIKVGYPVFSMTGRDYQRNEKGQILIDPTTGYPLTSTDWSYMGDRNPKLKYGITSSVSWGNFRLSLLIDGRFGATVVNGTKRAMMGNGTSKESVILRSMNQYIFRGVLKDGHENDEVPTPNNVVVDFSNFGNGIYGGSDWDWLEKHVNWMRLKEIRFQYRVPANWLKSATHNLLSNASVWVSANDLWTLTNYSGVDAVGNSNSASLGGTGGIGIDAWGIPTPRSVSLGVNLTF